MAFDPVALGLPHREPFIFLDEVVEVVPGESAMCRKTFSAAEPFFRGHFPGNPIVPGVILCEAMAQAAGIAAGRSGRSFLLSAIRGVKFPAAARPGEIIVITARKTTMLGALWQFEASAAVGEKVVAVGSLVLAEV